MSSRRVAVTGLGAVTPLGNNVDQLWSNLCAGRSGVGPITLFDASPFRTRIAAEARNFLPPPSIDAKKLRRLDRFALFGLAAALEAWADSGLDISSIDPYHAGVIIGSSHGGESTLAQNVDSALHPEGGKVSPLLIPRMLSNMAAAQVAMALGLHGVNFAVSSACATGAHAIGEAAEIVRRGDAQVMVCGGAEACITRITLAGDEALGALSARNEAPERASRPFDRDRDGFVLGEGSGVLILEDLRHAEERGARIYCELTGYAATSDAAHETRPDEAGVSASRAMAFAMQKARLRPEKVGAVFAHATSTQSGDRAEAAAIRSALGETYRQVPVTAVKSMLGHLLGAAAAVQTVAAVKTLQEQLLPPTINLDSPDPDCALGPVPFEALPISIDSVITNAFGFGGHNVCLALSRV